MTDGQVFNPFRVFVGVFIPNAVVRNPVLTLLAKLLYGRLSQYAGRNGQAFPKQATLAAELAVDERSARRAITELCDFGLIRVVKATGAARLSHAPDHYEFLWHAIFDAPGPDENEGPDRKPDSGPERTPGSGPIEENQREENQTGGGGSIPLTPSCASKPSAEADGDDGARVDLSPPRPVNASRVIPDHTENAARQKRKSGAGSGSGKRGPVRGSKPPSGKITFQPETTVLPIKLDTAEFRAAWVEWCSHRAEIKKLLTPTMVKRQLLALAEMGQPRAIAAIHHSIAHGWQGIFEPKGEAGQRSAGGGGEARVTDSFVGSDGQWNDVHTEEELKAIFDQPNIPPFPFANTPRTPEEKERRAREEKP